MITNRRVAPPIVSLALVLVACVSQACVAHRPAPSPAPASASASSLAPPPLAPPASATSPSPGSARIEGVVKDGNGEPLPGVSLRIASAELVGASRTTTSDAQGHYAFPHLPPGSYGLTVELFGFKRLELEGLRLDPSTPARFDPVLAVEGVEVGIEVRAHEDIVQSERSQTSTSFGSSSGGGRALHRLLTGGQVSAATVASADDVLVVEAEPPGLEAALSGRRGARESPVSLGDASLASSTGVLLPLRNVAIGAEISDFLARTELVQVYENTGAETIEALYTFPLPTTSAVRDFLMEVGDRRIVGVVRPKEEARRIYEEARGRGQTASLLVQEQSNVFTQSVANVPPGAQVTVRIAYAQAVVWERGRFEFVQPLVVGPRYRQGGGEEGASSSPQAAGAVPVSLEVELRTGAPLAFVDVPTHGVTVTRPSATRAHVSLAPSAEAGDRDFVLRYAMAGAAPELSILAHRAGEERGYFTALLLPPLEPALADLAPREVTFVVDTSGSMQGLPMEISRRLVRSALEGLRPVDRFNLVRFSGDQGRFAEEPVDATPENVARGIAYLDGFRGDGGTEMLAGIRAYLATPADDRFGRIVCFLTDGMVAEEREILATIEQEGASARWFAFGIGSSVNRSLIEGIGRLGRGSSTVVLPRDERPALAAAESFLAEIQAPALSEIHLDFGGLDVSDLEPALPRTLAYGRPVAISGRYSGGGSGTVTLRAASPTGPVELARAVELPLEEPAHEALAAYWARMRMARLMDELVTSPDDEELVAQLLELALSHRLSSPFTSFVAVDPASSSGGGAPIRVVQPLPLPEGGFGR